MFDEFLVGNTIMVTWINSGQTPSEIGWTMYDGNESVVNTNAHISSGNGHYYGLITTPDTPGLYVVETLAVIGGNNYRHRDIFRAIKLEVD